MRYVAQSSDRGRLHARLNKFYGIGENESVRTSGVRRREEV